VPSRQASDLRVRQTWHGQWWVPGKEERPASGTLTYDPDDGLRLQLLSAWRLNPAPDSIGSSPASPQIWDVIHGMVSGVHVTLLDTFARSYRPSAMSSHPLDSIPTEIRANRMVLGAWIESSSAPVFSSVRVELENLLTWSGRKSVSSTGHYVPDGRDRFSLESLDIEPTQTVVGSTTYSLEAFQVRSDFNHDNGSRRHWIEEREQIAIRDDSGLSLDDCISKSASMRDLFTLASLSPSPITLLAATIVVAKNTAEPELDADGLKVIAPELELPTTTAVSIFMSQPGSFDETRGPQRQEEFLFSSADIDFAQLIPRWIGLSEHLHTPLGLVIGRLHQKGVYLELQALAATGVLESLHRSLYPKQKSMTNPEFNRIMKAVGQAIPEDRKAWWADRKPQNGPTLRERLRELFHSVSPHLEQIVGPVEIWAGTASTTRNKLAHEGTSHLISSEQLRTVISSCDAVAFVSLAKQLGIDTDAILERHYQVRQLADAAYFTKVYHDA
jgi:hypothetical protein